MAVPDPDSFNFGGKLLEWAYGGLIALGGLLWKSQGDKLKDVSDEVSRQRDNIAKIFDKIENHSTRAEDRHRELMHTMHEGLSRKADR